MMEGEYKEFCRDVYERVYSETSEAETAEIRSRQRAERPLSRSQTQQIVTSAQKEAIKQATMQGMRAFPDIEAADIWASVYEIHVHHKSGIDNAEVIEKVISADQSWKKSSGHAFEEMVKILGSNSLRNSNIDIILQRDLSTLIKAGELSNEPRDISWLKEQTSSDVFDLYAVVNRDEQKFCYGCLQSKTSIRDRVTRDREPSIQAMQSYFWSAIIVLDGSYLKNQKFTAMVNGNTSEFPINGWHGMYVFSDKYIGDRIYELNMDFTIFRDHAIEAAEYWLRNRQWFDETWKAADNAQ